MSNFSQKQKKSKRKPSLPDKGLIVGLDLDDIHECLKFVNYLNGIADIFKIPSSLALEGGRGFLEEISSRAPLFLDLKIFDIPNTMRLILKKCSEMGVDIVTAHSLAGKNHLKKANEYAREFNIKILGVTVLTSMEEEDIKFFNSSSIGEMVIEMAKINLEAGSWGIVCSAREARMVKEAVGNRLKIVCPGIRELMDEVHDQKRISSPEEAGRAGADFIVVSRPILESEDPPSTAKRIKDLFLKNL